MSKFCVSIVGKLALQNYDCFLKYIHLGRKCLDKTPYQMGLDRCVTLLVCFFLHMYFLYTLDVVELEYL